MHEYDTDLGMAHSLDDLGASPDSRSLAENLEPALRRACGENLSKIEWFRSSWQRGGAATGAATWTTSDGNAAAVIVKIPVGPVEYDWTTRLGRHDGGDVPRIASPTPRVFASGDNLEGYDLGWLVMERLTGPPLSQNVTPQAVESLLAAAASFYASAAAARSVGSAPRDPDWEHVLSKARQVVKEVGIDNAQHWNESLKRVQRALPRLEKFWSQRPIDTWCHGDLHPGNAMMRQGNPDPVCVLIDLSHVHPGHWVEDAVYLERLYWGKPEILVGVKPVSFLAKCCRDNGLETNIDYAALASVRRVLAAATVPLHLETHGHPRYLSAALEVLDRSLGNLGA